MKVLFLLIILLCTACAHGRPPRLDPRNSDAGVKLLSEIIVNPEPATWRRSKWYRPSEDLFTPARIYVAGLWGCVMGYPEVDEPLVNHYYRCPSGWRPPSSGRI